MLEFVAEIKLIGINPYVDVPEPVLTALFLQANKNKGAIPICGAINGKPYTQTLLRFKGAWRLYINMLMLKDSPKRIGETITISLAYDPASRLISPHPKLLEALENNQDADTVFKRLRPSLQHEIVRYIDKLKTEECIAKNVAKAIDFLLGKGRFVGREKP